MPFPPSYPGDATVRTVMDTRPDIYDHWHLVGEAVMRGPSAFTPGQRELIAGYVSGVNACDYCHGGHTAVAVAFGFAGDLMPKLLDDVDSAPIGDNMKPVLNYVRNLTLTPSRMVQADADAVLAAGWDEGALHDAVAVCCYFNFMNRLVLGHGIAFDGDPDSLAMRGERKKILGYANRGDLPGGHPLMAKLAEKKKEKASAAQ